MLSIIRPIIGLYLLLIVVGLLDYNTILELRILFLGIPINLIETTSIALLPAFLILILKKGRMPDYHGKTYFGLILMTIGVYLSIQVIQTVSLKENTYEAARVILRSFLLIGFAYLYTRLAVSSFTAFRRVVFIILVTGLYLIIRFIIRRFFDINFVSDYLSLGGVGSVGVSNDFAPIFIWSSIIYGYHIFRSKFTTYSLFFISLFYYIMNFIVKWL